MQGRTAKISKNQAKDTGMAMVLILLLAGFFTQNEIYYKIAIPVLLLNMACPMIYYPVALVWLGFSRLLGAVISKIILTIIFIVLVIPVGLLWRLIGKDPLKLKKFKKGADSVMEIRDHTFVANDLKELF